MIEAEDDAVAGTAAEAEAEELRAKRQRDALRRFMATHKLKPHPWSLQAGVSSGSIYAFLKGESQSLSLPVATKLAAVVGASVSAMLGEDEGPPPITANVTHHLRGDDVHALARGSRRRAPMPRDADADLLRVAEVQNSNSRLLPPGAMIYWHDRPLTLDEAARRISIIDVAGRGLVLGDPRPGFGGKAVIVTVSGSVIDDADVVAAYLVEWIRPSV